MTLGTMVWTVTYRTDSKSPQQELDRYTAEAANHFAQGIIDAGGVAIVTEDFRSDAPANEEDGPIVNDTRSLTWD